MMQYDAHSLSVYAITGHPISEALPGFPGIASQPSSVTAGLRFAPLRRVRTLNQAVKSQREYGGKAQMCTSWVWDLA